VGEVVGEVVGAVVGDADGDVVGDVVAVVVGDGDGEVVATLFLCRQFQKHCRLGRQCWSWWWSPSASVASRSQKLPPAARARGQGFQGFEARLHRRWVARGTSVHATQQWRMGHARFCMLHLSCAEHAQYTAVQLGAPLSITSTKDAPFANLAKRGG